MGCHNTIRPFEGGWLDKMSRHCTQNAKGKISEQTSGLPEVCWIGVCLFPVPWQDPQMPSSAELDAMFQVLLGCKH